MSLRLLAITSISTLAMAASGKTTPVRRVLAGRLTEHGGLEGAPVRREAPVNTIGEGMTLNVGYTEYLNLSCRSGSGANDMDASALDMDMDADPPSSSGLSLHECQQRCVADLNCNCITFERVKGKCTSCPTNQLLVPTSCAPSSLADTYVQLANVTVDGVSYSRRGGYECHSATTLSTAPATTPSACMLLCNSNSNCTCVKYERSFCNEATHPTSCNKTCYVQSGCPATNPTTLFKTCNRSNAFDLYRRI